MRTTTIIGIEPEQAPSANHWIACPRPRPQAELRLFCFPYAGGAASAFWNWPTDLPPEVEVCSIQLPGRESRLAEPPFLQMGALLNSLSAGMQPFLDKRFAFFGHSMGAIVGFELARRFRRRGLPGPIHVFVSGSRAAHIPEHKITYNLPDRELLDVLRKLNGTPEELLVNPAFQRVFLPLVRADLAVDETYAYTPEDPLPCPITAFCGLEDPEVSREESEAWKMHTSGKFSSVVFPGNHFFLRSAQGRVLQSISEILKMHLARSTQLPFE